MHALAHSHAAHVGLSLKSSSDVDCVTEEVAVVFLSDHPLVDTDPDLPLNLALVSQRPQFSLQLHCIITSVHHPPRARRAESQHDAIANALDEPALVLVDQRKHDCVLLVDLLELNSFGFRGHSRVAADVAEHNGRLDLAAARC